MPHTCIFCGGDCRCADDMNELYGNRLTYCKGCGCENGKVCVGGIGIGSNDSYMLFHECPNCNSHCNCNVQPCSCCDNDEDEDEDIWHPCDNCDLPDSCEDFGCAIKSGVRKCNDW